MTKKKHLLFTTLLLTISVFGQNQNETSVDSLYAQDIKTTKILIPNLYVLEMGQLSSVVAANSNVNLKTISIKYPQQAMMNETQGTVYARFLIDTLGVVNDIKIIKGLGNDCSEEVLRVLKITAKAPWKPIIIEGKKVIAYQKIFVKFSLGG